MDMVGAPELLIVLVMVVFWGVPIVAGIWALGTLKKIRDRQQAMQTKLDTIERLLQRS